ncbi:MAG: ABC transporter ATP-binding protein [Acidobacteriia bacterium]|jgi:ABC-type multidrug transport system fused ATPase/permease subunit|nr:ABC transporter ATP-binding protein [Terriglobia bacterium]
MTAAPVSGPTKAKKPPTERLRKIWPEVRSLVVPRRNLLLGGFVLIVIGRICGLVLPLSSRYLIDEIIGKNHFQNLVPLTLAVLGATAIQALCAFTVSQLLSVEGQKVIAELRQKVQEHIGRLPITYYDSNKTGQLVSRIMSDVEGARNLIGTGIIEFFGGILTAVASLIFLLRISPLMTGIAFAIVVSFALVMGSAFKKIRPIFRERSKIYAEVSGRLTESLGGVRVIKGYHAEEREARSFSLGVNRLFENVRSSLTAMSLMSLSATILMGFVGALVMYIGSKEIAAGSMTLGGYVTFVAFLAFLVAPIIGIVNIGTQLTEALAGLERTHDVLMERPEDEDPERVLTSGTILGDVAFQNVKFSYAEGKEVLHGISFHARPGTVTAFVGPSGSGKSTTIGLIAAFHKATGGTITVDGQNLNELKLGSYRGNLGVVLQETFLFDGSVRDNVMFSRPEATEAEFLEACRIARVDEFAEKMESSYATIVGERGVKLSGGQRQRLSIARAILANPRILILDEATSSLDSESEAMIQEGLNHLMKGRTTFVIAHRLSTIRRAHQILVIEGGNIVEEGTHNELFARQGRYWDMYTRQHRLDENLFLAPGEGDQVPELA